LLFFIPWKPIVLLAFMKDTQGRSRSWFLKLNLIEEDDL